jgi:hypothetical protein
MLKPDPNPGGMVCGESLVLLQILKKQLVSQHLHRSLRLLLYWRLRLSLRLC